MSLTRCILITFTCVLLASCARQDAVEYTFDIDGAHVMDLSRRILDESPDSHYADRWIASAIVGDTCALWLDPYGTTADADTFLLYLRDIADEGLAPDYFGAAQLQARADSIRSWALTDRHALLTDSLAAVFEAGMTQAYLRYVYGQRYGYVQPRDLHNHLLVDADSPDKSKPRYRRIYDIQCEVPTDSFAHVAIDRLRRGDAGALLRSVQPPGKLHSLYKAEYRKAARASDTTRMAKAAANIERSRWRYARPDTGRYVLVNLAAQTLWAVDTRRDTCIDMRICCGSQSHKSPILSSRISYIELNPYWNVPQSIVRNEVVKSHLNDSAYFARNRMEAIDNSTHESIDPTSLTAEEWHSGRYSLRQDKGKGNSLGRIVFRFPNSFAVYLHDTNSPGAFSLDHRTVSHGCIRLQHPMALASFLLAPEATPLYIDRIRLSIDLDPLTDEGRKLKSDGSYKLNRVDFKHPVPLWIDYYTLYPDPHGKMCEYPDVYGYDKAILKAMRPFRGR